MLDPKWAASNGEFADNTTGDISALKMRSFASDIAAHAVTSDWFEFTPDTPDVSDVGSTTVTHYEWFDSTNDVVSKSGNWTWASPGTDYGGSLTHGEAVEMFLTLSSGTGATITFSNMRPGTKVTPVVAILTSDSVDPSTLPQDLSPAVMPSSGFLDFDFSKLVRFPSNTRVVRLGLKIDPSGAGQTINEGGTLGISSSNLSILGVTQLAAV